jgi:hypothetical protein
MMTSHPTLKSLVIMTSLNLNQILVVRRNFTYSIPQNFSVLRTLQYPNPQNFDGRSILQFHKVTKFSSQSKISEPNPINLDSRPKILEPQSTIKTLEVLIYFYQEKIDFLYPYLS